MATTTFTTTAAEDARLAAWATASGFPNAKACIVATIKQALENFEGAQNQQTYIAGYTPINPV